MSTMKGNKTQLNRRRFLGVIGTGSVLSGASGVSAAKPGKSGSKGPKFTKYNSKELAALLDGQNRPVNDIALEIAEHPKRPFIAFTTPVLGDGFQMYLANGISSPDEKPHTVTKISDAEAGVHALSWVGNKTVRYSQDGKTFVRTVVPSRALTRSPKFQPRVVDDRPLPLPSDTTAQPTTQGITTQEIDYKGNGVLCADIRFVGSWCVRADIDDNWRSHRLDCGNTTVPHMPHAHLAFFKKGSSPGESGVNLWAGKEQNNPCIWIGEEWVLKSCIELCAPEEGLPSFTDVKNAFENLINDAADAAGIAIPGVIVVALAYYLATSTFAPPIGIPAI